MVTYHLENDSPRYPGQWVIVASYGNDLQWVVGHYRDKSRAQRRLDRLHHMIKAQHCLEAQE